VSALVSPAVERKNLKDLKVRKETETMLGEKIGELSGRTVGTRVLPFEAGKATMEVSLEQTGQLFGVNCTDRGTYRAISELSGFLSGAGQGVLVTNDGEMASWTGYGRGRPTGRGFGVSWRGCIFYQTSSQKLARLNGLCAAFEHEVDEKGQVHAALYEWK